MWYVVNSIRFVSTFPPPLFFLLCVTALPFSLSLCLSYPFWFICPSLSVPRLQTHGILPAIYGLTICVCVYLGVCTRRMFCVMCTSLSLSPSSDDVRLFMCVYVAMTMPTLTVV